MKKPVIIFSTCDEKNFPSAVSFFNSLTKFHKPSEVDMVLWTTEKKPAELSKLPKGIKIEDLTPYLKDAMFFYRQKPILAEQYMDEYELVLGMDADQIVLGDMSYIFNTKDYDIGTVINWNRYDIMHYPQVDLMRLGIYPLEYFNCGLVAMRNKQFVHNWRVNCFTPQFDRSQYKEQDILNVLCYFGNWNVRCFDHGDGIAKMSSWWGIIGKGEWNRAELRGIDIVVPKGFGDTPFPPSDMTLKVAHMGGGSTEKKDNWGIYFPEIVMKRIQKLIR